MAKGVGTTDTPTRGADMSERLVPPMLIAGAGVLMLTLGWLAGIAG